MNRENIQFAIDLMNHPLVQEHFDLTVLIMRKGPNVPFVDQGCPGFLTLMNMQTEFQRNSIPCGTVACLGGWLTIAGKLRNYPSISSSLIEFFNLPARLVYAIGAFDGEAAKRLYKTENLSQVTPKEVAGVLQLILNLKNPEQALSLLKG